MDDKKEPVVPWFENSEFMAQVIQLGIGEFLNKGGSNSTGLVTYLADEMYKLDGPKIASLVKEHNASCPQLS